MAKRLWIFASLCVLAVSLYAADDGQTQPKLNNAVVNWSATSADIVATTNGAGNVKGVHCQFLFPGSVTVRFYVNGGSAQSISLSSSDYPMDSNSVYHTGFIPFNVRFTSSIRVQMVGASGGPQIICTASWGLD
jgi:hypothetical protein